MKKNYYAKALALTVAASMVSVPAFAAEGTDDPQAQEETVEQDEQKGEKSAEEDEIVAYSEEDENDTVNIITEGICGGTSEDEITNSAKWKLTKNEDDTYTLTISGEGEVYCDPDKLAVNNTWKSVAEKISVINVEEGITALGGNLTRYTNAATVYLPASLETLTVQDDGLATLGNNYYKAGEVPTGIGKVVIAEGNKNYKMIDGVLFNMDETVLIKYTNEAAEDYVVPDGVIEVSSKAFARSGHIRSLKLNEGLVKIGADCFDKSQYIEELIIPASVETIGSSSFAAMPSLKSITFKNPNLDGYSTIGSDRDHLMKTLTVNLPEGVKRIPDKFFSSLTPLEEIVLPDSVEEIGTGAFRYCENLKKITIGKSIKKINGNAFYGVPLESLVVSAENDLELAGLQIGKIVDNQMQGTLKEVFIESTNGKLTITGGMRGGILTYATIRGKTVDFAGIPFGTLNTADSKLHTLNMTGAETISNSFTNEIESQTSSGIWYLAPPTSFGSEQQNEFGNRGIIYLSSESAKESLEKALEDKTGSKRKHVDAITNGGTFAKNTVFEGGKLATPTKKGYTFDGWYDNANFNGNAIVNYEVEAPTSGNYKVYYAKWTLANPVIAVSGAEKNEINIFEKVYDGKDVTLSISAEGAGYRWYKVEGETKTEVGTERTLTLKDVAHSGRYVCEVTANGETKTSDAVVVSITQAKAKITPSVDVMKGAGSVALTVDGIAENEINSVQVVCDDTSVTVKDNGNGKYTAYLPNATKTYTFTIEKKGEGFNADNYVWNAASCNVSVSRKKSSSSSSDTSAPTYGVSTGKTENGEISVTPAKAEAGETVTIKATPDSGYQLDKMTVKDKNNSTVKLKKADDNEYTFTMPVGKVSVDATFVQKDAADDSNAAEAGKTIKLQIGSRIVNVDNEAVIYDAAPVIRNDRTLVPIRIITEALGGKVDWNGATKEVTLSINDKEIKMTIGKMLEKYGVAPVIIDGRTFVPVRFVADELGAEVAWDEATKTVTIKTAR